MNASVPLAAYVTELIDLLGADHPASRRRMLQVVGRRRARVVLDDSSVDVGFDRDGALRVTASSASNPSVDGIGMTDSDTVADILAGRLEVMDAIMNGRLEIYGNAHDVAAMLVAIEILLDAAPRAPAMQRRARDVTEPATPRPDVATVARMDEIELLARLGLLAGADNSPPR